MKTNLQPKPVFLSTSAFVIILLTFFTSSLLAEQLQDLKLTIQPASRSSKLKTSQAEYAGEFYRVANRKVHLLRSLDKVAIRHPSEQMRTVITSIEKSPQLQRSYSVEHEIPEFSTTVLRSTIMSSLDELAESIQQLELTPDVTAAFPVYINEENGLEMIPTGQLVVKLAPGAILAELDELNEIMGATIVRRLRGTTNQFILALSDCTVEELFQICEAYWQDPITEWAEPAFLAEVVKCDNLTMQFNDPFLQDQWHLEKINAPQAWDTTTGSGQIVIAVLDDGMDLAHEDLKGNLPSNPGEIPNNGIDDDENGYIDDYNGWNFWDDDKDPSPTDVDDNHGTAVAGIAAAKGNNSIGVSGCAPDCRLMPLKVVKGSPNQQELNSIFVPAFAEAVRYAAGATADCINQWRGADVIVISLGFSELSSLSDALHCAATQGRNGKGCPIFCASGNNASTWDFGGSRFRLPVEDLNIGSGEYKFGFHYSRGSDPNGEETVRIDDVCLLDSDGYSHKESILPDENFEGTFPPPGWSHHENSSSNWYRSSINAKAGTEGSYSVRSPSLSSEQFACLLTPLMSISGNETLAFNLSISMGEDSVFGVVVFDSEANYITSRGIEGYVPIINQNVSYPASNSDTIAVGASTDCDLRSDYSQYGADLDFVAPSNGGWNDVITTDRTDEDGYNDLGNYTFSFGGTSATAPLAAGVGALILSKNPDLTASEVRQTMRNTCEKIGGVTYSNGINQYYGYGRIDAKAALDATPSAPPAPDNNPPNPNPMTWYTEPYAISTSAVSMQATTASDPAAPVQYYFDFYSSPTSGSGGTDSGWRNQTSYTNSGLDSNHKYGYRVKAKDANNNETAYSSTLYTYTYIENPSSVQFGDITSASIQAKSSNTPSGLTREDSGLIIENITKSANSGWKQDNDFWTSTGLSPNTQYGFRSKARNSDRKETNYTSTAYKYTCANPPGWETFGNVTGNSIQVRWTANGNPQGTLYLCENMTNGTSSGWIDETLWINTGLSSATSYDYRVCAKNGDETLTNWMHLGSQSTITAQYILTIDSTDGGYVQTPGEGAFTYYQVTTVNIVAVASANYQFAGWSGTAVDVHKVADPVSRATTVTVDANYTLRANFIPLTGIIYVDDDATGSKNGSSWDNAFTSLQDALAAASSGEQIWVAQGIYRPNQGTNVSYYNPIVTFQLKKGVTVKGGYAGTRGLNPNIRDISLYETVLNGDLLANDLYIDDPADLLSDFNRRENCYHVVSAVDTDETAVIDGFTITAGNADAGEYTFPSNCGGGIIIKNGSMTAINCTFHDNAAGFGGAVFNYFGTPHLTNCTFKRNSADHYGGAAYNWSNSHPSFECCTFETNFASQGGAIFNSERNRPVFINCIFNENSATEYGGAMRNHIGCEPTMINCEFANNTASSGGAILNYESSPVLINCLLTDNTATTGSGGAIFSLEDHIFLTNCTIANNTAENEDGGGLYLEDLTFSLENTILWGNRDSKGNGEASQVFVYNCPYRVNYCCIQGLTDRFTGVGNIGQNPNFVQGGYQLASSPCIDTGSNSLLPADDYDLDNDGNTTELLPVDLAGELRIYNGIVDMGAYENQGLTGVLSILP